MTDRDLNPSSKKDCFEVETIDGRKYQVWTVGYAPLYRPDIGEQLKNEVASKDTMCTADIRIRAFRKREDGTTFEWTVGFVPLSDPEKAGEIIAQVKNENTECKCDIRIQAFREIGKKLSKNQLRMPGVTNKIRRFFMQFPETKPKDAARILGLHYETYRNMLSVEKHRVKKYLETKVLGRLPKRLPVESHRVTWTFEEPLPGDVLACIEREARRRKPSRYAPKPVGEWYVAPNRNRMRFYTDEHVSIRVFPISKTIRIEPGHRMAWPALKIYVQNALFAGGVDLERCEEVSEQLVPQSRHKTFAVPGLDTTFKIDHYRDPLGLTIQADRSHPEHLETVEEWPSWIKPQLKAIEQQTGAITELTEQIRVHLSVMRGIGQSTKEQTKAITDLKKAIAMFTEIVSSLETKK